MDYNFSPRKVGARTMKKDDKPRVIYNPKLFNGGLDFSPESIKRTDYIIKARHYGRRFAQLQQLNLYLQMNPEQGVTVLLYDKAQKKQFIDFAKHYHIEIKTTRLKKWGNAWQYTIKSMEYKK